jgi:hypothetical protein
VIAARHCRRLRRWALPGLALLLCLSGLPGSVAMGNRAAWKSPVAARQFREWSRVLGAVGVTLSPSELEGLSWDLARGYLGLRRAVLGPWQGVRKTLGTDQSWTLFAVPQTDPARLTIEVETTEGWRVLYVSRSETYNWRRATFDQNKLRKLIGRINRTEDTRYWNALLNWVSREAFQELPEVQQVRMSLWRWHTPAPDAEASSTEVSGSGPPSYGEATRAADERGELVRTASRQRREAQ